MKTALSVPNDIPRRKGRIAAAGSDLGLVAQSAFVAKGFLDPRLVLDWQAIAGADIARISRPLKLSGGTLTLKCEPGAAAFLQLETRNLCARIATYLGATRVERLKFVQGPLREAPPPTPRPVIPADLPPDDPAWRYEGPEPVRSALLKLARARRSRLK